MPCKEEYERFKAQGVCTRCGRRPAEEGKTKCKECKERQREYNSEARKAPGYREYKHGYNREWEKTPHRREYMREYRQTPQYREYQHGRRQTPEYREYQREYKNRIYGIYCCYMPQLDQFKLGYGGVYNRLSNYRVTDPNTTIVAYTELDKKTAMREERKILRETLIYNSNGSRTSEMRINCAPVRQYIKDTFEVINDETILNTRARKRIVQAKL